MIKISVTISCDHTEFVAGKLVRCVADADASMKIEMYQNNLYYGDLEDLELPPSWALERNHYDTDWIHHCPQHATPSPKDPA